MTHISSYAQFIKYAFVSIMCQVLRTTDIYIYKYGRACVEKNL